MVKQGNGLSQDGKDLCGDVYGLPREPFGRIGDLSHCWLVH